MKAHIGYILPLLIVDMCTSIHHTSHCAYKNWPIQFRKEKVLRGSKYTKFIHGIEYIRDISRHLANFKGPIKEGVTAFPNVNTKQLMDSDHIDEYCQLNY